MKVEIESTPITKALHQEPLVILNGIISVALKSETLNDFRSLVSAIDTYGYEIGFGSSHAWVNQENGTDRILLITAR